MSALNSLAKDLRVPLVPTVEDFETAYNRADKMLSIEGVPGTVRYTALGLIMNCIAKELTKISQTNEGKTNHE